MRNKSKVIRFLSILMILLTLVSPITVSADENTADRTEVLLGGILAYKLKEANADNIQEWIDGALTEGAGASSEFYIIALRQSGEAYDFSHYRDALSAAIASKGDSKDASSMLKLALAYLAVGGDSAAITALLDKYAGELGIMSWVFALHLLNNGIESTKYTADDVIDSLLDMRLSDGGWALTGQYSDVDITSMTIQALAPSYDRREDVKNAVDEAVAHLSSMQLTNGSFQSYGTPNPESSAQVIVALSSLGIDALADTRFIKDGDILDGMLQFKLEDGSFKHLLDGGSNAMATQQAFYAMIAYRYQKPFYIFDTPIAPIAPTAPDTEAQTEYILPETDAVTENIDSNDSETQAGNITPSDKKSSALKPIICAVIAGGALILCIIFFVLNKRNPKNFIIILLSAAVLILLVSSLDISLPEEYYGEIEKKENIIGSVTISISCKRLVELGESSEHIPADGMLVDTCEFNLAEGESAYDITVEAARKFGIQIDAETANDYEMAYVRGIGYLYELDFGSLSGWIYHVNGEAPSVSCGEYMLKDGDVIEWHYSTDLGNDLK